MFENLENAVKRSVEKDIVCCGSSAYLLEFADAMDKLIILAHTGTLFTARDEMFDFPIQYFVPSHNCSNFSKKIDMCVSTGCLVYDVIFNVLP